MSVNLQLLFVIAVGIFLPASHGISSKYVKRDLSDFDSVRLNKKEYDRVKDLHNAWYLHSVKALMGQMGKQLYNRLPADEKYLLRRCLDDVEEKTDIIAAAICLTEAKNREKKRIAKFGVVDKDSELNALLKSASTQWVGDFGLGNETTTTPPAPSLVTQKSTSGRPKLHRLRRPRLPFRWTLPKSEKKSELSKLTTFMRAKQRMRLLPLRPIKVLKQSVEPKTKNWRTFNPLSTPKDPVFYAKSPWNSFMPSKESNFKRTRTHLRDSYLVKDSFQFQYPSKSTDHEAIKGFNIQNTWTGVSLPSVPAALPSTFDQHRLRQVRIFNRRYMQALRSRRRQKRSPYRLIADRVTKSDSDRVQVKSMSSLTSLAEKQPASPLNRVADLLLSVVRGNHTVPKEKSWSNTYKELLKLTKGVRKAEKSPGAKVYDLRMYDLVLGNDKPTRSPKTKASKSTFLEDAMALVSSLTGKSKYDRSHSNVKLLSPRFAPLLPDKYETTNAKLSPSVLSFYHDETEEQIASIPKLLEATGMEERDREKMLETIMELSGARETVDGALKVLNKMNILGLEGELLTVTRKIMKLYRHLAKKFYPEQKSEIDERGFTFLEPQQIEFLHKKQGIHERDDIGFRMADYVGLSKEEREEALWARIEQFASNLTDDEHRRTKRFTTLSVLQPVVLAPFGFTPVTGLAVLGPIVLSPAVFTPLLLNPSVLGPYVFSPTVGIPFILSPYLMSPYVISPLIMAPFILNPYCIAPNVINPYVLSPLILSPLCLCPDVASPMVLGGAILAPSAFSPSVLSKSFLMASVLSPSFMS